MADRRLPVASAQTYKADDWGWFTRDRKTNIFASGFAAVDLTCSAARLDETKLDIRGDNEVAAETGISLRYLQKLFTICGSTFGDYISSLRLDHAAHLIERRALMKTGQPLSDIAYACCFHDYTYFARRFRQRFGTTPGAVGAGVTGRRAAREQSPRRAASERASPGIALFASNHSLNGPWSSFLAECPSG